MRHCRMERHHQSGWERPVVTVWYYLNFWLQGCSSDYLNSTKTENLSSTSNYICLLKCVPGSKHLFRMNEPWKLWQVTSGETSEIEVNNWDQREIVQDGPLYLRIIISRVTIDSRSTVSYIWKTLSELDDYMTSVDSNVTTFVSL